MAGTRVIQAVNNLKIARDLFQDLLRERPNSNAAPICKTYVNRIEWIFKDLVTNPNFDADHVEGIKAELNCDAFTIPAIMEKIAALRPDQRESVEMLIDCILKGESIEVSLQA